MPFAKVKGIFLLIAKGKSTYCSYSLKATVMAKNKLQKNSIVENAFISLYLQTLE